MRDDDRQLSIKALKELIATEEDAGPADQKEYDLQRITLATLEAREREHAAHIARWSAQIARLESGEAVESLDIELGPYRLIRMLGQGGNGLVWLAEHPMPDGPPRLVAIKVLQERWRQHPERVDRFRREIGVMGRIQHRSIVPIYDYDVRRFFVVMPYLAGGTLRDRLQGKPVPEAQALSWLGQIGAALDFVHDRHHELLHRDVKPENMLFADDGETLYLSDFGLVFSAQADEPITQDAGRPIGTGRYMAPEQWRKQPLSRATDLYAVGIVAYELLTGHRPFQATNDLDLGNAHCGQDLPEDPALTLEVLRILRKAAAKHPADRYPTARAFLTDLRNWREDPANLEPRIRDYLEWITEERYDAVRAQFIELAGDETSLRPPPTFSRRPEWQDEDDLFARVEATLKADHVPAADDTRREYVENVRGRLLQLDKVVLIGEPGSGKSWMLRRLQADYARAWLTASGDGRGLVPVYVALNKYEGGAFADLVKQKLDTLAPYHDQLLRDGRLVLLCDALNEMPRRSGQLAELLDYLKAMPQPRFVVSCRLHDYRDDLNELKPLEQVLLRELELPAILEMVTKRLPQTGEALWRQMGGSDELLDFWYKVAERGHGAEFWNIEANWYESGHRLTEAVYVVRLWPPEDWYNMFRSGSRLIPLSRNPYLCDLVCHTYRDGASHLPSNRAALFRSFVTRMLARERKSAARRGEAFPEDDPIEVAMVAVARHLQDANTTVLAWSDALAAIEGAAAEALLRAATDASILVGDGEGLRFAHQLLQEYFAVRILLEAMPRPAEEFFAPRLKDWWDLGPWKETIVILSEFLGESEGANQVAKWLAPYHPEEGHRVLGQSTKAAKFVVIERSTYDLLVAGARVRSIEQGAVGRASAYRVLGVLDADVRPGIGIVEVAVPESAFPIPLPNIDWVTIPDDGPWTYQEERLPGLPAFEISRYPITFAQFQTFLDDPQGWPDPRWWDGLAIPEGYNSQPDNQNFPYTNHPLGNVSWFDAMAFCRWWSWRLGAGHDLDRVTDWAVRLPTEFEWEKATRGTDGREYPYVGPFDATKGNTVETGIKMSSAVGIFPGGRSPYGVHDLSGNVWEWCLTDGDLPVQDPAQVDLKSYSLRVLRGGSWIHNQDPARAVSRVKVTPNALLEWGGFRVVRGAAPVR